MTHSIFLALGTNQGDRLLNLRRAIAALPPRVIVTGESRIYETPPWGVLDQPPFLNMALAAQTGLSPRRLLTYLKQIERALGRVQTVRYGPRIIDLDILFYDRLVVDQPGLTIPHPRLPERAFVLVPLAEIAPGFVHPQLNVPVRDLLDQVDGTDIVPFDGRLG